MLKRKMEQKLIDWKNTENHKPLIINVNFLLFYA